MKAIYSKVSHAEKKIVSDADRNNGGEIEGTRAGSGWSLAGTRTSIPFGKDTLHPEEPKASEANKAAAATVSPRDAERMTSHPDIVNSTVQGLINLGGKVPGNGERATFSKRRITPLADGVSGPRSTNGRKVQFSEILASSMDSTTLPHQHDQPRWVKRPKHIVCRKCRKWCRIVPRKKKVKKTKVSKTRCSCNKGELDAKEEDEGIQVGNERSIKKRVRDERGEEGHIPQERNGQSASKKSRKLR